MRRPILPLLLATALLLPAAAGGAQAAAEPEAVHPFYAELLEQGIYTYHRGDPASAAGDLRLAVFGLLEEPALLAEGLAYLALAREQTGDAEAARETLGRLLAVEDRFGAWAGLELSPVVRQQAEELLMRAVPEEVLAASPGFRRLADEMFLRRLEGMRPAERLEALRSQVEGRPGESRWVVVLAAAELEVGETREAARLADQVLESDTAEAAPHHPQAHCILGQAAARNDDCPTAAEHLDACPRSRHEAAVAAELLACQVELERWPEARQLVATLPPAVLAERPVERLVRRLQRAAPAEPAPAEPAEPTPETGGGDGEGDAAGAVTTGGADAETGPDGGVDTLPADARARLEEARRLLSRARRAGELEEPLRIAREVADAHPGSAAAQHLAGEIAYRASRWRMAAEYYARGGAPERAEQRFYMAVALFESGDREAAAGVLETALPDLPRTPFVTSYVERILGAGADPIEE